MKKTAGKIFKGTVFTLLGLVVLVLALLASLALPPVQSRLVMYSKKYLEKELNTKVEIGYVDVGLPKWLILRKVVVYDKQNIPFLQVKNIKIELIDLSLRKLIWLPEEIHYLTVGRVELKEPHIYLYTSCQDSTLNLMRILPKSQPDTMPKKPGMRFDFRFSDISIENATFRYADSVSTHFDEKLAPERVNFANINVVNLNLLANFVLANEGRIEANIRELQLQEVASKFTLKHLKANIVSQPEIYDKEGNCVSDAILSADSLQIDAGKTHIDGNVIFPYGGLANGYIVNLKNSAFEFAILDHFTKPIPVRGIVNIEYGKAYGSFTGCYVPRMKVRHGKDILADAKVRVEHWDDELELLMDVNLHKGSTVSGLGLMELLPEVKLPSFLKNIEKSSLEGTFNGKYFDFQTKAALNSPLGNVTCDMKMKIPEEAKVPDLTYEGYFTAENVNFDKIGIVADRKITENISFKGIFNGAGTDLERLHFQTDMAVTKTVFMGYTLDSLNAKVEYAKKKVQGQAFLSDGTGYARADILDLDFSEKPYHYRMKGIAEKLDLFKYEIYKDEPAVFSSILDVDLKGDTPDNIVGFANLNQAKLSLAKRKKVLELSDIQIDKQFRNDSSLIQLKSSFANGRIAGVFHFEDIEPKFRHLYEEIKLSLTNNVDSIADYYRKKQIMGNPVSIFLKMETQPELNRLLKFLELPVFTTHKSNVSLFADLDQQNGLEDFVLLNFDSDSSAYDTYNISKPQFVFSISKPPLENRVWLQSNIKADAFYASPSFILDTPNVSVDWGGDYITTRAKLKQRGAGHKIEAKINSKFFLDGRILNAIDEDSTFVTLQSAGKSYDWRVRSRNSVEIYKSTFSFENLVLETLDEQLKVSGKISKNPNDTLFVELKDINFNAINKLTTIDIGYKLDGKINGIAYIQNLFNTPMVNAKAVLNNFTLDGYRYGDVHLTGRWDSRLERINVLAQLIDGKNKLLDLEGYYGYRSEEINFALSTITELPMRYITPFVKEQLYDIEGGIKLTDFRIYGIGSNVDLLGKGSFHNAGFGFGFFKTKYRFNGDVFFDKNIMEIRSNQPIILHDKHNHTAEFYGGIHHKGLKQFEFDLQLKKMSDFLVMETTKEDNETFYGTVIAKNGIASITGDLNKLAIDAFGVTGKGSFLKIPISDDNALDKPEYVHFSKESELLKHSKTNILGIEVNLNIQATEDAQVDLIFDEHLGDIISGKGQGTIQMNINPQGDFFMFGNYEISEGNYLFTTQNFLNKKFFVKPGGKIIWSGDPFNAQIDLQAYYPVYADAKVILKTDYSLKSMINVLMKLQGSLMKPDISLSIEQAAQSTGNQQSNSDLAAYLKTIEYDQQEMNKQVFFLLTAGQFAPTGEADAAAGGVVAGLGTAANSVSEFLSNQLNYFLAKTVSDKVNVSLSSNNLNMKDVSLQVSAKLWNDRITIERDGALVNNNTNFSIGNISVMAKLRSPEKDSLLGNDPMRSEWVGEVFFRNNQATQVTAGNQTGAGIYFKKDFDSFGDLLRKKDKRKKDKPKPSKEAVKREEEELEKADKQ